jgi:hypothetical protein
LDAGREGEKEEGRSREEWVGEIVLIDEMKLDGEGYCVGEKT